MLPDFLKVKEKLKIMIDYKLKQAILSNLGPLAEVPESIHFEGSSSITYYADGTQSETESVEIRSQLKIELEEVETMTPEKVHEKIDLLAQEMAKKQARHFYKKTDETAEEDGTVVNAEGAPFSMDLFFEALEKIDIDFDENGDPIGLTVAMSPELFRSAAKTLKQAENDPDLNKRFDAIMERKKEKWRVRENNRKLVG